MMHLDEAAVRAVLTWDLLIPAMESALSDFSAGRVIQPVRSMITVEEGRRYPSVMPAAAENAMGLKLVSLPRQPRDGPSDAPRHDPASGSRDRAAASPSWTGG